MGFPKFYKVPRNIIFMDDPRCFYVLARKKDGGGDMRFVSYHTTPLPKKPIFLMCLDEYAMTESDARGAEEHLLKIGYEVIIGRHFPDECGIDLDTIIFNEEVIPELTKLDLRDKG